MTSVTRPLFVLALTGASLGLVACGGGGGGGSATPPAVVQPPPSNNILTWTPNVYAAASNYKDRCAVPRTGVDANGDPFPDRQGSILYENFWLRSWTHETYLWNDEVTDRNPALYDDPIDYFDLLKTDATTSSGSPKDNFHFSQPTSEYLDQRNSTASASYGISYTVYSTRPPRDFRVSYTDANSPASEMVGGQPKMKRGTRILTVDGVDLVNGGSTDAQIDILNEGLYPSVAGVEHTFEVQDEGSATTRTVTMVSANLSRDSVNRTSVIDTPTGKVGYILFNTFSPFASEKEIVDAITEMDTAGVDDLVLDLRYNGGGLLAVASQLGYMVAGPAQTNGKTFEMLEFNDDAGNRNPVTGEVNEPVPFIGEGLGFSVDAGTALPSLDLNRVYILSTDNTCSASEAVINGLRGADVDVVLIGTTTCGKPYGFYPTDNCGTTFYTIQFRGVNDKGFGAYADGFVPNNAAGTFGARLPGCEVADDLGNELGDPAEALLAAALNYRNSGSCPAAPSMSSFARGTTTAIRSGTTQTAGSDGIAIGPSSRGVLENNRDLTGLPGQP
ncbi:S41 family peptidase [Parvularcula sp. LCG005]|uniref:S41 family peptidase n=1 Tax=Parvularcula sp. LCG005 TaxID=3078805 RepID=UPI002943EB84|nr:S41 family peptidase [Parvularcula sp. LCG005]WOI54359.1 S41 family peptidase [Parvularcula sp. LCG005]